MSTEERQGKEDEVEKIQGQSRDFTNFMERSSTGLGAALKGFKPDLSPVDRSRRPPIFRGKVVCHPLGTAWNSPPQTLHGNSGQGRHWVLRSCSFSLGIQSNGLQIANLQRVRRLRRRGSLQCASLVHGAEMRVAETRAVNRALRKAYGIGICSVEEIGSFDEPGPPSREAKKLPPQPVTGKTQFLGLARNR